MVWLFLLEEDLVRSREAMGKSEDMEVELEREENYFSVGNGEPGGGKSSSLLLFFFEIRLSIWYLKNMLNFALQYRTPSRRVGGFLGTQAKNNIHRSPRKIVSIFSQNNKPMAQKAISIERVDPTSTNNIFNLFCRASISLLLLLLLK